MSADLPVWAKHGFGWRERERVAVRDTDERRKASVFLQASVDLRDILGREIMDTLELEYHPGERVDYWLNDVVTPYLEFPGKPSFGQWPDRIKVDHLTDNKWTRTVVFRIHANGTKSEPVTLRTTVAIPDVGEMIPLSPLDELRIDFGDAVARMFKRMYGDDAE